MLFKNEAIEQTWLMIQGKSNHHRSSSSSCTQ